MDQAVLFLGLALLLGVAGLSVAAERLRVPVPILMLAAGIALSFLPGLPPLRLEPDLVLLLLLPPLLYASGVGMSWRGFRSNLRPILLLAIGCVVFTAAGVAAVCHLLLGLPWAIGFLLGAIVAPPDAVAPMAIARRLGLPRRITTVLEGESLVNDATALVLFAFALGAVATGGVDLGSAIVRFAAVVTGEIGWGIAVGWTTLRLRHIANEPRAEVLIALATPFIAFWPPHGLGGSGVVACVAAGLWVSWNGRGLIRPATRLQGFFIWGLVVSTIEGMVFLLTGLEARVVVESLAADGLPRALAAAAVVTVTVVLVRFAWVFPATYLPRLIPAVGRKDPMPNWRLPFMVGLTGLRGVVSLAAALSIPLTLNGAPFPERDLVLFVTFAVIVATVVGLGALLPPAIDRLGLARTGAAEARANKRDERQARLAALDAVLAELQGAEADGAPGHAVEALRRRHADRQRHLAATADETTPDDPVADDAALQLRLIAVERRAIGESYAANRLTDEARRRIERELDLEEARLRHAVTSAADADPQDEGK